MRNKLFKWLLVILFAFFLFWTTNATFLDSKRQENHKDSIWTKMLQDSKPTINVDCANEDCSLTTWTELVKDTINDIEKERTFSEYIQDIVAYLLTFISIIAVIYIIYSGFVILTAAWDEEKIKKTKATILHVIIWIVLIWLAYPITLFIIKALNISS